MEKFGQIVAGTAVELFLAALALGILYRVWGSLFAVPKRMTVLGYQLGVVLRGNQFEKTLEPGRHWISPKRTLLLCDMRTKPFQIPSQELLTADRMAVRVSLGGEYRIANPALFVTESSEPFAALYLELRQALLKAASETSSESIVHGQAELVTRIRELVLPRATQLGVELTQLDVWEATPIGRLSDT